MVQLSVIFNSLKRQTSGGKFIPIVDGIRFMAILPIVILHANERLIRYVLMKYSDGWLSKLDLELNNPAKKLCMFTHVLSPLIAKVFILADLKLHKANSGNAIQVFGKKIKA